jgi:hypothetical protein
MKNTKKQEILSKIFNSKWNQSSSTQEHIISLFYTKGGFVGLYDYIITEQTRMSKDKHFPFNDYYNADLPDTLLQAKTELQDSDFEDYIFSSYNVSFNKNNFAKLKEYGLLKYFYDFGTNFRGDIVDYHKIGEYTIIETYRKGEAQFYNVGQFTCVYNTLEQALLTQIFKERFSDTLFALLDAVNQK